MSRYESILSYTILDNAVIQIIVALLIFTFIRLNTDVFNTYIASKIRDWISGTHKHVGVVIAQIVAETPQYFFIWLSIYFPLKVLNVHPTIDVISNGITAIVVVLQLIRIANKLVMYWIDSVFRDDTDVDQTSQNIVVLIAKILIWLTGVMLLLINFGVEITPLLASLGIGGIAIAFALQNILSDMFSSFSIFLDKPFKVGDLINIGTDRGNVTDITLKSTRIKTLNGHDMIIPNKQIMTTNIYNYAHLKHRIVSQHLCVVYQTKPEMLRRIPGLLRDIVTNKEQTVFKRSCFKEYADSALMFEVVYDIRTGLYDEYLAIRQEINYDIFEAFAREGIQFAYPTQTLHVHQESAVAPFTHLTPTDP